MKGTGLNEEAIKPVLALLVKTKVLLQDEDVYDLNDGELFILSLPSTSIAHLAFILKTSNQRRSEST